MTDKKLDDLFKKQDIKLSASFNDSIFAQIKESDKNIDKMFFEDKLTLNSDFNDTVLDEARIESFFKSTPVTLGDSFCDSVFAKLEKASAPRHNIWSILTKVSGIAALFLTGIFLGNEYFSSNEFIESDSKIYAIAKENINTEIDYFLLEDDMNELSQEIDCLEAYLLEVESYSQTMASI